MRMQIIVSRSRAATNFSSIDMKIGLQSISIGVTVRSGRRPVEKASFMPKLLHVEKILVCV